MPEGDNIKSTLLHIIAIARGGGKNLEIFENPGIAKVALSLSTHFITALGHAENVPLLQKIADKSFITPTALGQYLKNIYNNTKAELQSSKAKLINDCYKHLAGILAQLTACCRFVVSI